MKLNEGLRHGDLKGLVQNIVSVDEYKSKIDDLAIVFAFYVQDRHAAEDANRFIQKSYVDLLDTEVSAAPDQMGNYLVFVEMSMNDNTAAAVAQLCDDLGSLSGISKWIVQVRGAEPSEPLPPSAIEKAIRSTLHFTLDEFFSNSDLKHVTLTEGRWVAATDNALLMFNLDDFGSFDQVVKRNDLTENAVDLSSEALRSCKYISSLLGPGWYVEKLGEHYAVYQDDANILALMTYYPL